MASPSAHKRLTKELRAMEANPVTNISAVPNEANILEWHYVLTGSPDTPYDGGQYHGTLLFPPDYPFKPPRIMMCTPSGRFKPNAALCLSISDFHPEWWNPAWSVSTILIGLQSFMNSNDITTGSLQTNDDRKRELAKKSIEWNVEHNTAWRTHFPDEAEYYKELLDLGSEKEKKTPHNASADTTNTNTASKENGNSHKKENREEQVEFGDVSEDEEEDMFVESEDGNELEFGDDDDEDELMEDEDDEDDDDIQVVEQKQVKRAKTNEPEVVVID